MRKVQIPRDGDVLAGYAAVGGGAVWIVLQIWHNSGTADDAPWIVDHPLTSAVVVYLALLLCTRVYVFISRP